MTSNSRLQPPTLISSYAQKKVFVRGCFDLLHSGHVCFLEQAEAYGDVCVGIGSDRTIKELKGRYPVNTQEERKYMLEVLRHVKACFINQGSGIMDFLEELDRVSPDYFVVNEEENTPAKLQLCRRLGIQYVVLKRTLRINLPARSTTSLRRECGMPYRLDLAGGWLETHLHLVPLGPRQSGFQVLKGARITPAKVRALASAADYCWDAIRKRDLAEFGRRFRESFEAQVSLFPKMADQNVRSAIALYAEKSLGWKLSGAGGGGYLVLVGRHDIRGAIKIKIRRKSQ